jgi:glycerol-3-phosphate dehydrogenase
VIDRNLQHVATERFDLIVIGGGILGASLALEATLAGLRPLLLEARDFGGGASWNSLRILHGGLRYLQSADLPRFVDSVAARRELSRRFPDLVEPLACVMPLYRNGLRRVSVMRAALFANECLSSRRNRDLALSVRLPAGGILDETTARARCPLARTEGLEGAAIWYDAFMPSTERVVIRTLHEACARGAVVANYVEVERLRVEDGRLAGVTARDVETDRRLECKAPVVVSCMGALVGRFADAQGASRRDLFVPSLAFNVLLDVELPGRDALAVAAPGAGAPLYFLVPRGRLTLAGTAHCPRPNSACDPKPSEAEVADFLATLQSAVPGLRCGTDRVVRILAGFLPVIATGSTVLTKRERVVDHGAEGGPQGFFSVASIKFTTAPLVAARALRLAYGRLARTARLPGATSEEAPAAELLLDVDAFMRADRAVARGLVTHVRRRRAFAGSRIW